MKMSDRNIKMLLVLLIIVLLGAPYYFYVMPMMEENETIEKEIRALQDEKARLEGHVAQLVEYQDGITENAAKVGEILAFYPRTLPQEAGIIFLDKAERHVPLRLQSVSFSTHAVEHAAGGVASGEEGEADAEDDEAEDEGLVLGTALEGIRADMVINYAAGYNEWKELLAYIMAYPERMVISRLAATFSRENQRVTGSFELKMYAVDGVGREPVSVTKPSFDTGTANVFIAAPGVYTIPELFDDDDGDGEDDGDEDSGDE